jgi:hypothetical protein
VKVAPGILLGLAALGASCALACTTLQASAAKDPQRCERDPKCASHQDKSKDCVTMCVDDPACIERCQEVNGQRW